MPSFTKTIGVCLNIRLPHMLGTRFHCIATPNTQYKLAVNRQTHIYLANCHKGQEKIVEEYEDASPTRFTKVLLGRPFKHEIEAIKKKTNHTNLDWYTQWRMHKFKEHFSGLETDEKPPTDKVHWQNGKIFFSIMDTKALSMHLRKKCLGDGQQNILLSLIAIIVPCFVCLTQRFASSMLDN